MTATYRCTNGHDSEWADYCSACGAPIGAPASTPPAATAPPAVAQTPAPATPTGPSLACPHCQAPNDAGAVFCEACGRDMTAAPEATPAPSGLRALVRTDREYYDAYATDSGLAFPDPPPPVLTVELDHSPVTIGRRRKSKAAAPDIDLSGEHDDPAVSHRHAELRKSEAGEWSLVDVDSTNGTRLERDGEVLAADTEHPIGPGSSLWLGAWTRIDIRDA